MMELEGLFCHVGVSDGHDRTEGDTFELSRTVRRFEHHARGVVLIGKDDDAACRA